jgi:L-rhamnose mutarotase
MKRYGMTIHLRPETEASYKQYHREVWPDVLATIAACNIRNYSIYLHGGILFGYMEYIGKDFAADMAKMAADPATQRWWAIMEPMQQQLPDCPAGEWWTPMEEVFHTD